MKQRNSVQYLLMILSIIIYGLIASRVWSYFYPSTDDYSHKNQAFNTKELTTLEEKDSFSLNLDYPDPFTEGQLNNSSQSTEQRSNQSKQSQTRTSDKTRMDIPVVSAPKVIYQGYSLDNDKINRVRLQVEGKGATFQLHENKLGIQLLFISRDSIIVNKNGKPFVFYRK